MINKDKVQRTLKCFEVDKQIEQQTSNKNRLITILNWDNYQSNNNQIDKQIINKCETTDKQVDNKQEYKEYNNIYLFLFNKYKGKIEGQDFGKKIHNINECQKEENYMLLNEEEQNKLFIELMNIK